MVAVLVVGVPALVRAQAASDAIPNLTLPRDPAKVALIRQLLAQTHGVDQALAAMESGVAAQRQANPRIPAVFWDRFMAQARAHRGDLEDRVIVVYDHHFSTAEVRQLLAFYRTPVGQKMLAEQPALFQESMAAGKEWGRRIGMAVGQQLAAEGVRIEP